MQKNYWQRFLVRIFGVVSASLQRMPHARAMRFGAILGSFAFLVAGRHRAYARRNLRLTGFPHSGATATAQEAFIRRVFIHFAKMLVEFLRGPLLTHDAMDLLVKAEGFEHVQTALTQGKGIIIITAHLGDWEMLGRWLAQHGVPMTVVARDPHDPDFAAWVRGMRESAGFSVASKGGSVRELLIRLKKNLAIGLLPDQNSGDVFVPFMGVPAGTVAGPAILALHTGATLLPSYCVRLPDDTYRLLILPPISTVATGSKEADVKRIMGDVNLALERIVRQYPEQWLWLHNRWKSSFEEQNHDRCWDTTTSEGESAHREALLRWDSASV